MACCWAPSQTHMVLGSPSDPTPFPPKDIETAYSFQLDTSKVFITSKSLEGGEMCRDLVFQSLKDNQGVLIHGKFWGMSLKFQHVKALGLDPLCRIQKQTLLPSPPHHPYHHHYSHHPHTYHHLFRITLHHHYCHQRLNLSQTFPSVCVHCEPVFGDVSDSKDLKNRIPAFPTMGLF